MSNAIFTPKKPVNEPVKDYVAGSFERIQLDEAIAKLKSEVIDIPMYINGNEITSSEKIAKIIRMANMLFICLW